MSDEYDITGGLDLLGDWLDAKGYTEEAGLCTRAMDFIHKQGEENEKLRAALKPFATVASHGDYGGPLVQARIYYECETEERAGKMYIDSAAFRAAAVALKETGDG